MSVEGVGLAHAIWLDATHVVLGGGEHRRRELTKRLSERRADGGFFGHVDARHGVEGAHEWRIRLCENVCDVWVEVPTVLIEPTIHCVAHRLRVVHDDECEPVELRAVRREGRAVLLARHAALGTLRPVEAVVAFLHERHAQLVDQLLLRAVGHRALVIEHREDATALVVEEGDLRRVVREVDRLRVDALAVILLDAQLDERVHKVGLQPLVGEVDAQLLKRVAVEVLEAEDVEQPHEAALVVRRRLV